MHVDVVVCCVTCCGYACYDHGDNLSLRKGMGVCKCEEGRMEERKGMLFSWLILLFLVLFMLLLWLK